MRGFEDLISVCFNQLLDSPLPACATFIVNERIGIYHSCIALIASMELVKPLEEG